MSTSTEPHDRGGEPDTSADPVRTGPHRPCRNSARRPDTTARRPRISEAPGDFGAFSTAIAPVARCAESTPRYGPLRVDNPGDLIAALPAMVGFVPERSLVVAVLRAGASGVSPMIEAVVRFDLGSRDGRRGRAETFAACVGQICAVEDAREVLAIVVDDRLREPARHRRSPSSAREAEGSRVTIVAALDKRLARRGIDISGAWAVRAIDSGQRWWNLFDPEHHGLVSDPTSSPVALAQVLDGRAIHRSRADLAALLAEDTALCARVAAELDAAVATARERFTRAARHGDLDGYRRAALEYALWQIANTESGIEVTPTEIAGLVVALRDRAVRDSMFALAVGDHAAAAERLWLTLVRASRGPDRADIAALLGYSAYVRGDGPFAGIALDAALAADATNPMAILLETSLRAGMRPESLRRLARSGYATASHLGIDLGPGYGG